jgi:predicted DNA-binding transcriptional regulator YafY
MNRFERALGIVLLLRSGRTLSSKELASRFEVSVRTIYRDIETLAALGVPIYAEQGRGGGFRLVEGYLLPPIMFSLGEATSLLTGLALLAQLRVRPFSRDLQSASEKLLAALPEQMQKVLGQSERIIGFERTPRDIFHADTDGEAHSEPEALQLESEVITRFLEAIHRGQAVNFVYQTRHRAAKARTHEPLGLFWDRERWYLVTQPLEQGQSSRIWRADRVLSLTAAHELEQPNSEFQIEQVLGRRWLRQAMRDWRQARAGATLARGLVLRPRRVRAASRWQCGDVVWRVYPKFSLCAAALAWPRRRTARTCRMASCVRRRAAHNAGVL